MQANVLIDQESQIQKIKLQSSDGVAFVVDADVAQQFRAINSILLKMPKETFILPEVDAATLTMVIWVVKVPREGYKIR